MEIEGLTARVALGLAALMDTEGYTQVRLAKATGVTQQTISRALGAKNAMTLRTLAGLAYSMGYRVNLTFERITTPVRQ